VYWPYRYPASTRVPVVELRLPKGEVEVRGRMHARATVGDAGRVHGFVVDPADDHVTHLILQAGHLLGGQEVAVTCRWWDASGKPTSPACPTSTRHGRRPGRAWDEQADCGSPSGRHRRVHRSARRPRRGQ
jgi:hypothetical protein